jgi:hypothetical protein
LGCSWCARPDRLGSCFSSESRVREIEEMLVYLGMGDMGDMGGYFRLGGVR